MWRERRGGGGSRANQVTAASESRPGPASLCTASQAQ